MPTKVCNKFTKETGKSADTVMNINPIKRDDSGDPLEDKTKYRRLVENLYCGW